MSLLTLFQKYQWNTLLHMVRFFPNFEFFMLIAEFWGFFLFERIFFFFTKPINWLLAVGSALTLLTPEVFFPCDQFEWCDVTCWSDGNIHPVIRNMAYRIELKFQTPRFHSVLSLVLGLLLRLSDCSCSVCTVGMTALLTPPRSESQPSWERSWRYQSYLVRIQDTVSWPD